MTGRPKKIKSNQSTQPGSRPFKRQGGDPLEMVLSNLKSNIILTHSPKKKKKFTEMEIVTGRPERERERN